MDIPEAPLFQLPVPAVLTENMEGIDRDIEMNGIDSIGGGGGGGGGGLPPESVEKEFDVVDPDTGLPSTFIFYGREP